MSRIWRRTHGLERRPLLQSCQVSSSDPPNWTRPRRHFHNVIRPRSREQDIALETHAQVEQEWLATPSKTDGMTLPSPWQTHSVHPEHVIEAVTNSHKVSEDRQQRDLLNEQHQSAIEADIGLSKLWQGRQFAYDDKGNTRVGPEFLPTMAQHPVDVLDESFMKDLTNMSSTAFAEFLRRLDPDAIIGPSQALLKNVNPRRPVYNFIQIRRESGGNFEMAARFLSKINIILQSRRESRSLGLSEYKLLLRITRAVGDARAASEVWESMRHDGLQGDVESYNHFMATHVWADTNKPQHRHNLRLTSFRKAYLKHEQTRDTTGTHWSHLHGHITKVFANMVQEGLTGDEETFCLLMVAQARDGDTDSVEAVLQRVWNIDVADVVGQGERSLTQGRQYRPDSPLCPSEMLLLSIAHIYGINNKIPTALKLIDHISRLYSITIQPRVWRELLERTYVIARKRSNKASDAIGNVAERLSPSAISNLFKTFAAEPYNVQPQMHEYDMLIMSLIWQQKFGEAQDMMLQASLLHKQLLNQYLETLRYYQSCLGRPVWSQRPLAILSELRMKLDNLYLRKHRSRQYILRWCRVFIARSGAQLRGNPEFLARGLPRFLQTWHLFLPRNVEFPTTSGRVRLSVHKHTQESNMQEVLGHRERNAAYWDVAEGNARTDLKEDGMIDP